MKGWVNIRTRETKKARVEIIPMIDAIFFLLVFFMYSSLSMVKMSGMGVSIPKLVKAPPQQKVPPKPPKRYIVTMNRAGTTFINLDEVPLEKLSPTLQGYIKNDPEGTIVVNVAKEQTVQKLVDVMDKVNTVTTPKGAPATVIVATSPVDPKAESANQGL
ncbi:MAG: biopolymer transporter ExbD [Cytophagales bacterium]|nr:biopolymer transporter ExbD [Armatimonadota bacterium]